MESPGMNQTQDSGNVQKKFRPQNLMPMTINQIHRCSLNSDYLSVHGYDVQMVVIVALVKTVEQLTTHVNYDVTDYTGNIRIQHWLDDSDDKSDDSTYKPMVENTYIEVMGTVKTTREQRHMVAFSVRPVTDLNRLTAHLLEVMHCKKKAAELRDAPTSSKMDTSVTVNSNIRDALLDPTAMIPKGLTQEQGLVYRAIQISPDSAGCSLEWVIAQLEGLNHSTIRSCIQFLSDEGHIYSTIDENHFKVTDSF